MPVRSIILIDQFLKMNNYKPGTLRYERAEKFRLKTELNNANISLQVNKNKLEYQRELSKNLAQEKSALEHQLKNLDRKLKALPFFVKWLLPKSLKNL